MAAWRHLISQVSRHRSSEHGQIKGLVAKTYLSVPKFEGRSGNRFLFTHHSPSSYVGNLDRRLRHADKAIEVSHLNREGTLQTSRAPIHTVAGEGENLKGRLWYTLRPVADRISKGLAMRKGVQPSTRFIDVRGIEEAKAELEEVVHFLRGPKPRGVLLVVPPWARKKTLARAIAGEAEVPFFSCSVTGFFQDIFVGAGARKVKNVFAAAKKHPPCIIFIDEIDSIGRSGNLTLNQLLVELDGLEPNEGIIVLAATSFPRSLDKSLTRHGRLDHLVVVPNPDEEEGRMRILEFHLSKVVKADDIDLRVLARGTPWFSALNLANLVNAAVMKATVDKAKAVSMAHFKFAKENVYLDGMW